MGIYADIRRLCASAEGVEAAWELLGDEEALEQAEREGTVEDIIDALVAADDAWAQPLCDLAAEAHDAGADEVALVAARRVLAAFEADPTEEGPITRADALVALGIVLAQETPRLPRKVTPSASEDADAERAVAYRTLAHAATDGDLEALEALLETFHVKHAEGGGSGDATDQLLSWVRR